MTDQEFTHSMYEQLRKDARERRDALVQHDLCVINRLEYGDPCRLCGGPHASNPDPITGPCSCPCHDDRP